MTTQEGSHTASQANVKGASSRPNEPNSPTQGAESLKACTSPGCCVCPGMPRCPKCGYTAHDAAHLMDHETYCGGQIPERPTPTEGELEALIAEADRYLKASAFTGNGKSALHEMIANMREALAQPRPASTLPGDGEPGVPRVEAVIAKMREAVAKIQDAKKRGGVSRDPLIDPINAMPGWARELEMAVIDIEGDYEAYEDKLASPPPGVVEALRQIKLLCLTMGAPGHITAPAGLARIIRLCIDAGVTEGLEALAALAPTPQPKGGE